MRIGDWMQTYSGKRFWPLDPRLEEIHILDIAAALSKICRYGGHTLKFYSVAEHSILVSNFVPKEYALWGLLHDASEAYLSDLVKPLKSGFPAYRNLENRLLSLVAKKFGLGFPTPEIVSRVDRQILRDEQLALMAPCKHDWWCTGNEPIGANIIGLTPIEAEQIFLTRFYELNNRKA
jgi:hypothetical protein